ncbi:MAG: tetratricopeptide repeat protein, partial [Bacteroidota bacterium]
MRNTGLLLLCISWMTTMLSSQSTRLDSLQAKLATTTDDRERAIVLHELFDMYVYSAPDTALQLVEEAFAITAELGEIAIHTASQFQMGHALYVTGNLDRFKDHQLAFINYLKETDQEHDIAPAYRNLAKVGESRGQPDSSLLYIDLCLEYLASYPDSVTLGDVHISKCMAYLNKGFYAFATEEILTAIRIAEQINRPDKEAYAHLNAGNVFTQVNRDSAAIYHYSEALDFFRKDNNLIGQSHVLNNLGQLYRSAERWDEAITAHEESIALAEKVNHRYNQLANNMNLVKLYYAKDEYERARPHVSSTLDISREINHVFAEAAMLRFESRFAIRRGDLISAKSFAQLAERLGEAYYEPVEQGELYYEMAEIMEGIRQPAKALAYLKKGNEVSDSLYTIEQDQKVEELKLIYETEKKDAAIAILNKQTELDATRKRALWGGLALLALLSGVFIYSLIQRKRKKEALLTAEKMIEVEKRKSTERELEFKQKELTAKVLQLARKNEFLSSLETEIVDLKSSVDSTVSKTTQRISRMINRDADDDGEWEQFGREFSSVHQDFLDRLKSRFGTFSKSEMR